MSETIAAIATASGNGSISILRVSGPEAVFVVDGLFFQKKHLFKNDGCHDKDVNGVSDSELFCHCLFDSESHTVHYGWIGRTTDELIDEALVLLMRAPHSYTAEDVVEIQCHGGGFAAKRILELLIEKGVRLADPGEFTKRAFLNGRIDLTQAESVMEVIRAQNDLALSAAGDHLRGDVRDTVRAMRETILTDLAYLEAALDDPEHIELTDYPSELLAHLDPIETELTDLLHRAENGRRISEGIRTVILGRPNVGKSSFLNCILRENRAIVTDVPGTTRDTLAEDVRIGNVLLRLIDTAGIRETSDEVEQIGVQKAWDVSEDADFVICLMDSSEALREEDFLVLNMCKKKPSLILLNKSDLPPVVTEEMVRSYSSPVLSFSSKTEDGLKELELFLEGFVFEEFYSDSGYSHFGAGSKSSVPFGISRSHENHLPLITNLRQKEALFEAKDSISRIRQTILDGMPEDLLTVDLLAAYEALGRVTGDTIEDDLVEKIFSEFCMGK